jgi:membrane-associated HD superfamily phosphohydrolase
MQECLDSKAQLAAAQQAKEGLHYETFEPGMAFFVILAVLVILIIVLAKIGLLGTLTMAAGKIAKTTVKAAYEMSPNNDTRNNMTEAFTGVKAKTTGEVNKEVNKMGGKLVIKTATVAGKLIDGNDK